MPLRSNNPQPLFKQAAHHPILLKILLPQKMGILFTPHYYFTRHQMAFPVLADATTALPCQATPWLLGAAKFPLQHINQFK